MIDLQYFMDYFNEFPFLIKLAWILSGLMALIITFLTVYLKLIRSRLRKRDAEIIKFTKEYEAALIEYLYAGNESKEVSAAQQAIIQQIKEDISVSSKRKIVISILYKLMNEVSGEISDSIKTLYFETGLIKYALIRLKNKKWHVIAKGIGELTRFKIEETHDEVVGFIKHPKREVRKEAHLYFVNLFRFEGLLFLDELKTPLSEWDQINLIEILQKFDDQQICDISGWLKSANDTVVLFALKLARIYNQFEVMDTLMDLLSHKSKNIRVCVIEVLTDLYGIEAKDRLKANFNVLSLEEQISFFGMLEKLVIPSDEPFVEAHLFHNDFEIQLLALKILKSINIDKYQIISELPPHKKSPAMLKFVETE
jgi:hypothetical protein